MDLSLENSTENIQEAMATSSSPSSTTSASTGNDQDPNELLNGLNANSMPCWTQLATFAATEVLKSKNCNTDNDFNVKLALKSLLKSSQTLIKSPRPGSTRLKTKNGACIQWEENTLTFYTKEKSRKRPKESPILTPSVLELINKDPSLRRILKSGVVSITRVLEPQDGQSEVSDEFSSDSSSSGSSEEVEADAESFKYSRLLKDLLLRAAMGGGNRKSKKRRISTPPPAPAPPPKVNMPPPPPPPPRRPLPKLIPKPPSFLPQLPDSAINSRILSHFEEESREIKSKPQIKPKPPRRRPPPPPQESLLLPQLRNYTELTITRTTPNGIRVPKNSQGLKNRVKKVKTYSKKPSAFKPTSTTSTALTNGSSLDCDDPSFGSFDPTSFLEVSFLEDEDGHASTGYHEVEEAKNTQVEETPLKRIKIEQKDPNDGKFDCPYCLKVFSWSTDFTRHLATHSEATTATSTPTTSARNFNCDLCPATFSRKFFVQRHKDVHHPTVPTTLQLQNGIGSDHLQIPSTVDHFNHFEVPQLFFTT